MLINFLYIVLATICSLSFFIIVFSEVGKRSDIFCKAPGLDLTVGIFTFIPWILGFMVSGFSGFIATILAEVLCLYLFSYIHTHFIKQYKGPRIDHTMNKVVGLLRNHAGLLLSLLALPAFLAVRLGEIFLYPPMAAMLGFPKYKTSEWINVSRHKFEGLVGFDLIWCLYCDWMTGVYALGGEMLRNVESFWCPIRYYEGKKCDNCKVDFPDIETWVPADGAMIDVKNLLMEKYPLNSDKDRSWFDHPDRK